MQVGSKVIKDSAITEIKIATGAVTDTKIGASAVTEAKIATSAVTETKIGNGAVTANKIGADAINGTKIADAAIDSEHIVSGAVDGAHLSAGAKQSVLEGKLASFLDQVDDVAAGSGVSVDITNKAFTVANTKKIGGSASVPGLVTDTPNNKAHIRNSANGDPIQDLSGRQVYGRQSATVTPLSGTSLFTQGSANVVGTGTSYTSQVAANDWIKLDASGKYYKVLSVTDNTHLTLATNYEEETASGAVSEASLTLSFYVEIGGVETAHTMGGETIDVMVPEAYDLYSVPFTGFVSGVAFTEPFPADHNHDSRYFTETELGASTGTTGADRVGVDKTAVVGMSGSTVQDGLEQIARAGRYEKKTIVTQDVIPSLTYTPRESASVVLILEGINQRYGASYDYTVSGKTVTWSYANSGIHIDPGDEVWVLYDSAD